MQPTLFFIAILLLVFTSFGDPVQETVTGGAPNNTSGANTSKSPDHDTEGEDNVPKRDTIASKVETIVKKEFAEDVKEAESEMGVNYNQSAQSGQVRTIVFDSRLVRVLGVFGNGRSRQS